MRVLIFLGVLFSTSCFALNYEDYLEVKKALEQSFQELKPSESHNLIINMPVGDDYNYWWNLDYLRASYHGDQLKDTVSHYVFLFGGYIRANFMTKDLLANTGCHEIAHGIGGAPFKSSGSSMEAQADYWATKICLPVVFKYLAASKIDIDPYAKKLCDHYAQDKSLCYRQMSAIEPEKDFFLQDEGAYLDYDRASTQRAEVLNDDPMFYPDAQCRFDTMIHGILLLQRPNCWYPKGIERILIYE